MLGSTRTDCQCSNLTWCVIKSNHKKIDDHLISVAVVSAKIVCLKIYRSGSRQSPIITERKTFKKEKEQCCLIDLKFKTLQLTESEESTSEVYSSELTSSKPIPFSCDTLASNSASLCGPDQILS